MTTRTSQGEAGLRRGKIVFATRRVPLRRGALATVALAAIGLCAVQAREAAAQIRIIRAQAVGQAAPVLVEGAAPPGQPGAQPQPAAAPAAGPAVVTVYEERLQLKPTGIEEGQLVLPGDPPRKIPLDEIDLVDLGNAAIFEAQWIGQDNRDLAQVGSATEGNGIQDVHVRLSGIPINRQIKQILIHGLDPSWGVWRLDPTLTPSWRIAIERTEGATGADLFFEPKGGDAFERQFNLVVSYDDGSSASASLVASTHTSDSLALAGDEGAPTAGDGPAAVTVHGQRGVLLRGQLVEMTDKMIRIKTSWGAETSFPTLEIRGLWFGASQTAEARKQFAELLAAPKSEDIALALGKEQAISAVTGTAESFAAGKLQFQFQGRARTIGAAKLVGLVFSARPPAEKSPGAYQVFQLTGGDRLIGSWKGVSAESLTIQSAWGDEFTIPQNLVSQVKFLNGKLSYVSDLEPTIVEEVAYFGRAMPYRRDKSLLGGPLKVKGKEYAKGLAVHARSVLTYNLDGQFKVFKSVVGFDETIAPSGHVIVRVLGDGKELFTQPALKGDGEPATVEASVEGVKQLALEIDFGELEDSGDRVVWADAKLYREVKPAAAPAQADAAPAQANPAPAQANPAPAQANPAPAQANPAPAAPTSPAEPPKEAPAAEKPEDQPPKSE